jgi:hypothetical protein
MKLNYNKVIKYFFLKREKTEIGFKTVKFKKAKKNANN